MKILLAAVGRPRGALAEAIADYEIRLRHYFSYETAEIREESFRRASDAERVRMEEGKRLLARVPDGSATIALHRGGHRWSSERLARFLGEQALHGSAGATFLVGGAFGLADEILDRADRLLSLSSFTLPHEMARLVWTEQLYRAGTILRKEPYHKGRAVARRGRGKRART